MVAGVLAVSLDQDRFEQLLVVIEELAAGKLETRYPISRAHDDVDAIGFGVNVLAEELSATIGQLKQEIAERKATELELREAERTRRAAHEELQTLRTARLASIGMLAAGVGHEINNPLTYVVGNLEYLGNKLGEIVPPDSSVSEEITSGIGDALDGAERIRRIVQDLRLFSRIEDDDESVALDVSIVVESALALVQNEIRHRARLTRAYEDVPRVLASEPRLAQVFVNILVNAVHALPETGSEDSEIRIVIRPAEHDEVVVEVVDTGAGIAKSALPLIFDPFFSTKPCDTGTGLGLSICRELISKMDGRIEVESEVGSGTTVRVSLPVATVDPSRHVEDEASQATAPSRVPRILIIDDDRPVARSLKRVLKNAEVTIAECGRQGLDFLAAAEPEFDVVLCDIMMPDMDGMEVFEFIQGTRPALAERFVFVTGGAFTDRAREFLAALPNRCLHKPFRPGELNLLIQELTAARGL